MALWISTDDADTYFQTRLNSSAWFESSTDQTAALTTAQRDLELSDLFAWPTGYEDDATLITDAMKYAVCEQALFRLLQTAMEDRDALRAMGVTKADVVGETYAVGANGVTIAPRAAQFLQSLDKRGRIKSVDIGP